MAACAEVCLEDTPNAHMSRYRKLVLGTGGRDVHSQPPPKDSLPLLGRSATFLVQTMSWVDFRPVACRPP